MVQAWCHIKDDPKTRLWEEKGPRQVEIEVLHFVVLYGNRIERGKFLYGLLAVLSF